MTIKHSYRAMHVEPRDLATGCDPNALSSGLRLEANFNNARNLTRQMIAMYSGRCDPIINGGTAPSMIQEFRIITGSPLRADISSPKRHLNLSVYMWYLNWGTLIRTWRWQEVMGGAATTLKTQGLLPISGTADTQSNKPSGGLLTFPTLPFTPVASTVNDGFTVSTLSYNAATIAGLRVAMEEEKEITATQTGGVLPGNLSEGQTLRGCSDPSSSVFHGSIDAIAELQNSIKSYNTDTMVHTTRRCLFQTPYPICAYSEGTGTTSQVWVPLRADSTGAPQTYLVRPRDLLWETGSVECFPALVLGLGTPPGVKIRYTSLVTGDTWTYTEAVGIATDTLKTASNGVGATATGLMVARSGDEILIEAYTSTLANAMVRTVSLWDPSGGLDV